MKRWVKILSIPVILITLTGSLDLLLRAHICGEKIASLALYQKAEVCDFDCESVSDDNHFSTESFLPKTCCTNLDVCEKLIFPTTIDIKNLSESVMVTLGIYDEVYSIAQPEICGVTLGEIRKPPDRQVSILETSQRFLI